MLTLDTTITTFLSNILPHTYILDQLFRFFSLDGITIIIWLIVGALFIIFEEKRDRKFILYLATSLIITFFFVDVLLKNVFQRPRPWVAQKIEAKYCPKNYSFPSTHAASAFGGAVILAFFNKKRRVFYYGIAFLISYSRIYLYCHYFGDVISGAIIGYFISYAMFKIRPTTAYN